MTPPGTPNRSVAPVFDTLSGFVQLLPFIEQNNLRDAIYVDPAAIQLPNTASFIPWTKTVPIYQCPSDGGLMDTVAPRSYHMIVGDRLDQNLNSSATRGVFKNFNPGGGGPTAPERHGYTLAAITDGTSNTLMFSERKRPAGANDIGRIGSSTTVPSSCLAQWNGTSHATLANAAWMSSSRYADGRSFYGTIYTILPPNSPSCATTTANGDGRGFFSATSNHSGGVNVALADGSIRFIRNSINTGNLSLDAQAAASFATGTSPYGVWGALGTASGGEVFILD